MTSQKLPPAWQPTDLSRKAFDLAAERHCTQTRKGGDIPYISHLLAVAALVIEHGGTEVQAAAALLHDVLEDTDTNESELTELVGKDVAAIVVACSAKRFHDKKDDSWVSKQRYLKQLEAKNDIDPSLLVALADKVHNSEACVNEYPAGPGDRIQYWNKFNTGYKNQEIWYRSLYENFKAKGTLPEKLLQRLEIAVGVLFDNPER